jgi:hypothetical protein
MAGALLLHVDVRVVLDLVRDLLHARELEPLQVEDHNVGQLAELSLDLGLRAFLALVALVEVVLLRALEGIFLQETGKTLVEGRLEGQGQGHEGVERDGLVLAPQARHDGLLHT